MQPLNALSFQEKMSKVQMICSPEHGHYIGFDRKNPYEKSVFQIPEESELFLSTHQFGEILTLKKDGRVSMVAFLFDPDFLPKS